MKPLIFQSVGDIELKDQERLEHVLNAAHAALKSTTRASNGGAHARARGGSNTRQNYAQEIITQTKRNLQHTIPCWRDDRPQHQVDHFTLLLVNKNKRHYHNPHHISRTALLVSDNAGGSLMHCE